MRKYLGIMEGRTIKRYNMDRITLPLTAVRQHLYRTDEFCFHKERGSNISIEFVQLENTQVWGDGQYLDPDETIAILDTAPSVKAKVANWSKLTNGGGMNFIYLALGVIMIIYTVYGLVFRCPTSFLSE